MDEMMLWQFDACVSGWNRAQGGDDKGPGPPSDEKFEQMLKDNGFG